MHKSFIVLLLSAGGGMLSTGVFLLAGHILDGFMNPRYANFISLLISASVNFILQSAAFAGEKESIVHKIGKYAASEAIIISLNQLGVTYLLNRKKKYIRQLPKRSRPHYSTISRVTAAAMVFLFVSFPLRKFWVFV